MICHSSVPVTPYDSSAPSTPHRTLSAHHLAFPLKYIERTPTVRAYNKGRTTAIYDVLCHTNLTRLSPGTFKGAFCIIRVYFACLDFITLDAVYAFWVGVGEWKGGGYAFDGFICLFLEECVTCCRIAA